MFAGVPSPNYLSAFFFFWLYSRFFFFQLQAYHATDVKYSVAVDEQVNAPVAVSPTAAAAGATATAVAHDDAAPSPSVLANAISEKFAKKLEGELSMSFFFLFFFLYGTHDCGEMNLPFDTSYNADAGRRVAVERRVSEDMRPAGGLNAGAPSPLRSDSQAVATVHP